MIISETIKRGTIKDIKGDRAKVKISCGDDACDGCRIASACHKPSYSPILKAKNENRIPLEIGDKVLIAGRVKGWFRAWLLLAGLPCVAILAGLVAGSLLKMKDGAAGLLSLGFVLIYYILLWRFRLRVDKNVEWIIESKITDYNKK